MQFNGSKYDEEIQTLHMLFLSKYSVEYREISSATYLATPYLHTQQNTMKGRVTQFSILNHQVALDLMFLTGREASWQRVT